MVNGTVTQEVMGTMEATRSYFYTFVVSVVLLLVGFILGILAKKLTLRLLREIELNRIMRKVNFMHDVEKWTSWMVSFVIYLITIVVFLEQLDLTSVVLYLVVGAILILLVLTFIVGLKDVIPNFVGWIYLQKQGKVQEGKKVEVNEICGVVEKIGVLETEIKTDGEDVLYVPNSLFLKNKFWLKKEKDEER